MMDPFTEILHDASLVYYESGLDEPTVCAYLNNYSYDAICTCQHMVDNMPFLNETGQMTGDERYDFLFQEIVVRYTDSLPVFLFSSCKRGGNRCQKAAGTHALSGIRDRKSGRDYRRKNFIRNSAGPDIAGRKRI